MPHDAWSSSIVVFILAMGGVLAAYMALDRRHAAFNRLSESGKKSNETDRGLIRDSIMWEGLAGRLLGWQIRRAQGQGPKTTQRRLRAALIHAGWSGTDKLAIFRIVQLLAAIAAASIGGVAALALGYAMLPAAVFGLCIGYFLPQYILRRIARNRQGQVMRELPVVLDLLVVCLEAGVALSESLKIVAREGEHNSAVIGGELATAAAEMSAGVSLEDSLRNLGERTGVDDVKSLAGLVIQSQKMGTRLGPALRASADLLISRRRMRAEESAQKSAVKMLLPLVLLILPAMMIVILGPAVIQIIAVMTG
jgi:tight adherence protein C